MVEPQDSPFTVDGEGYIHLTRELDFEEQDVLHFNLSLSDGTYTAHQNAVVTVNVLNVNEFSPSFEQEYNVVSTWPVTCVGFHLEALLHCKQIMCSELS